MSERDTDLSDETLTAYLDGILSRAEADMVADALVDSPPLAARLAAMEIPISELRPELERRLDEMPTGTLPKQLTQPNKPRNARLLSIVLAFILGLWIGVVTF